MRSPIQETLPFEDLPEVPTASPWCQRWRERRHSWAHVRDGGFDARRYTVDVIPDEEPAKGFVLAHHYSGSYPAVTVQFGLYDVVDGERRLCGVAVFGVPVSTAVLTKPLPELRPYTESLVCSRFVLLDECPANSESWFLANCLKRLLASGVHGVVSFADPVPRRTASGVLVMPGHVGTIYAATNAVYASRATARTVKLLPDGTVFHERTAQKIRRQEQGHQYAEAQLIALGAPAPRAGCNPAVWLREALVAVGARNVRHRGAHRYVWRLGRSRREREQIKLGLPAQRPYPKQPDPRTDLGLRAVQPRSPYRPPRSPPIVPCSLRRRPVPAIWNPPPTLSVHQLEGLAVIGHAHGPKDTAPWSTRPGNRTRYSIHAVDTAQSKLLVSISSVVIAGGDTEYPHPQRGVTGWAPLARFDLVLLTHLRTSGSYAGHQCHHHLRAYPEARPCWHCKARPPEAQCTYFTAPQPHQTGPVRDAS